VHDHPDVLGELPAYIHTAIVRTYIEGASHRGLRDEEIEQRLGQIDIPVRVLWGTQEAWIPPQRAQKLTA
jgi:pimeloyl-ACP methyl ester carboxylesterase